MPLYEYKCLSCEKVHEAIQKFSDAPLEVCPFCEGRLTKLMSMSSFSLKGTGWYTTDYKRSSAPAAAGPADSSAIKKEGQSKPEGGSSGGDSSNSSSNSSSGSSSSSSSDSSSGTSSGASAANPSAGSQSKSAEKSSAVAPKAAATV